MKAISPWTVRGWAIGLVTSLCACRSVPPATVHVAGLDTNKDVSGKLTIKKSVSGVTIDGRVTGLPPNTDHGFHVHENGDCGNTTAEDGTVTIGGAAGDHWNPHGTKHGPPDFESHLGDLGNLHADAEGTAAVSIMKAGVTLGGNPETDIVGRAVIIHADIDDLTSQPSGASGGRIACGIIK